MEVAQPDNLNPFTRIESLINELQATLHVERITHDEIRAQMRELEQHGITNGTPYFHQGKYLYMVFPMVCGKRRREYIGSDRAKIAAAEGGVARGHKYRRLEQELIAVERRAAHLAKELDLFLLKTKEDL